MCGRYACYSISELMERFNVVPGCTCSITPSYNISPYSDIGVVANNSGNRPDLYAMYWQLIPEFAREFSSEYRMFNTRVESFDTSRYKKNLLLSSRCIIPADNYYEWRKTQNIKEAYLLKHPDDSLMFLAGIYSVWKDSENNAKYSCSIITTKAIEPISGIHERMPLIIKDRLAESWLDVNVKNYSDVTGIIRESSRPDIRYYRISNMVNKAGNNSPDILHPITS